jgi:hypothetical protein
MRIEDVYAAVALSALETTPLDARLHQAQMGNYSKLVEEMQEANGHLKAIADKPPALAARP